MSWIFGGLYCGVIWLVFAKLKLIRLTLPIAILLASLGPGLILTLLVCAQYLHPFSPNAIVLVQVDPIAVQLTQPGRVTEVVAQPNIPLKAGSVLFRVDKVPYENAIEQQAAAVRQAAQNVKLAESNVKLAEANRDRAEADLKYATSDRERNEKLGSESAISQRELEVARTRYEQASAAFQQSEQKLSQARLSIDTAKAELARAEAALADAKYDLEQTTLFAPADGYVTNVQVREGLLISASSGPVMTFVRDSTSDLEGVVVATFREKNFLRIREGQYVELAMDAYPGQILTGRVLNTIDVSGTGQLVASGQLPTELVSQNQSQFAARIQLDNPELRLPGGAQGQVAVYTDELQIAGLPVMFLIRANSWLNYVL